MKFWVSVLFLLMTTTMVQAHEWQVAPKQSKLSFISVKKSTIGEVHSFDQLRGILSSDGHFELTIPLSSVDTNIDIRDERMQSMLFEVTRYPKVILSANIDKNLVNGMKQGDSRIIQVASQLALHGRVQTVNLEVLIAKLSYSKILVTSYKPVIINATDFNLTKGLDSLKAIAKLSSISSAVPVSFVLTLVRK
ncbi:MAG: YceI family protein [Parashewanella sp.]